MRLLGKRKVARYTCPERNGKRKDVEESPGISRHLTGRDEWDEGGEGKKNRKRRGVRSSVREGDQRLPNGGGGVIIGGGTCPMYCSAMTQAGVTMIFTKEKRGKDRG